MKSKNIVLLAIIIALTSCKKEIQLDLKEQNSAIVIEGGIANNDSFALLRITGTQDFNVDAAFPTYTGALVMLTDDAGNGEYLKEIQPGIYKGSSIKGIPGRTYSLKVNIKGDEYTAVSTMPGLVEFESLSGNRELFIGKYVFNAYPAFIDPLGEQNYYRFIKYINHKRLPGSDIFSDQYTDGNPNINPITLDLSLIRKGDVLQVEMQTIDKGVYTYFNSMAHTDMGSTAPSNPITNIEGGALGYFSAYTIQRKILIVK